MKTALRIILFLVIWFVFQIIFVNLFLLPVFVVNTALTGSVDQSYAGLLMAFSPTTFGGVLLTLAELLSTLAAVWVVHLLRQGPRLPDLGLRLATGWWKEILLGLLLGPIIFLVILLILVIPGWASTGPGTISPSQIIAAFFSFLFVAFSEEILMRGFVLQTIQKDYGVWPAVIGSSLLFAILHILNPGSSLIAIIGLFFAGLLFAFAYLSTGRLWLPIALHLSWNFCEGPIFGFPVSGLPSGQGLLNTVLLGPTLITGGVFGPEAGLVALFGIALAAAIIYFLVIKRKLLFNDRDSLPAPVFFSPDANTSNPAPRHRSRSSSHEKQSGQ
jgi:uncharacterized protein